MSRLITTIVQLMLLTVTAKLVYLMIQDIKENGLN
jgi:hypothetical protein